MKVVNISGKSSSFHKSLTIEFTPKELESLWIVTQMIAGSPTTSRRGDFDRLAKIIEAEMSVDQEVYDGLTKLATGSISFNK